MQHRDVGVAAEEVHADGGVSGGIEVQVRLVDDHQYVGRDPGHECVHRGGVNDGARGVIGIADEDQRGALGDGLGHGL
ncbi:hypothetical protein B857_03952 [Solibacillus isronensis B3W22]|uniref:Uncharacterized protein n=1 Tax=Solibacillus isronensis B3W22 TaxID=1224748 RepID=K1LFS2_9BACL|nr:hypothetical protein B857_03952 [Solibacillus isronensis B3W22]